MHTSSHLDPELLSAYLDDEVTARERTHVERHLAGCQQCRTDLEGLRMTVALVAALPPVPLPRTFYLTEEMVRPAAKPRLPILRWLEPLLSLGTAASALAFTLLLVSSLNMGGQPMAAPQASEPMAGAARMATPAGSSERTVEASEEAMTMQAELAAEPTADPPGAALEKEGAAANEAGDVAVEATAAAATSSSAAAPQAPQPTQGPPNESPAPLAEIPGTSADTAGAGADGATDDASSTLQPTARAEVSGESIPTTSPDGTTAPMVTDTPYGGVLPIPPQPTITSIAASPMVDPAPTPAREGWLVASGLLTLVMGGSLLWLRQRR